MRFKEALIGNFQHKIFAILAAIIIWAVVNKSITSTRVFTRVPMRIVNVPADKTIRGLLPNNILDRKLTLTITGTRDVIDRLDTQDFEVVIDASGKGDEWIVRVGKKNLVSLNPDIDLIRNVTQVSHNEFVIQLCPLVTEKIPIFVLPPRGEPPEGYQFLDVWPQKLTHIISGPEEDVRYLQEQGLELIFDLSDISKSELDQLRTEEGSGPDEVSFIVPEAWKKIQIPFLNGIKQEINGPEARNLRIDFLRKELIPLDCSIPVSVFYPLPTVAQINPRTLPLAIEGAVTAQEGVAIISGPFFVGDVSRIFLDIVKDRLEIVVFPPDTAFGNALRSEVQFIDAHQLEDNYVAFLLTAGRESDLTSAQSQISRLHQANRESYLRNRFREYMQRFAFYSNKNKPFELKAFARDGKIVIEQNSN